MEINSNGGECCLALAEALGKLEQWSEAVEYYGQAVLLFGESGEVLFCLGHALGQLQRWIENVKSDRELGLISEKNGNFQG